MAWAVEQKTGDAIARSLLLTLANYADEHGKCWPSLNRLSDDCEMHRATVIRKLEQLSQRGLITREQKTTPAGTYNVYTLSLTATPSRTERLPQSHTATTLVAQSDPILSDEPIREPIKVGRPKRVRTQGGEKFEEFWKAYPTDPLMAKKPAREAFERLSTEDQDRCLSAVPGFRAHCAKDPTYRPLHAVRFITQRRFEGFATVSVGASDAPVFMSDEEHAQWWASRRGAA